MSNAQSPQNLPVGTFQVGQEVTLKQETTATDGSIIPAGTRVMIVDNYKDRRTTVSQLASPPLLDDISYQFKAAIVEIVEIWLPVASEAIESKKLRADPALRLALSDKSAIQYISEAVRYTVKDPQTGLLTTHDLKRGTKVRLTSDVISPHAGGKYKYRAAKTEPKQVIKLGRYRLGHSAFSST